MAFFSFLISFFVPEIFKVSYYANLVTNDVIGCASGVTKSTMEVNSSVTLTHHDPNDLALICLVKKNKIRFRIPTDLESNLGFPS